MNGESWSLKPFDGHMNSDSGSSGTDKGHSVPTSLNTENGTSPVTTDAKVKDSDTTSSKVANMFVAAGKGAGTLVGVPIAVLGKAAGGLIGGTVGLSAGIVGTLGAGMGWIASGVAGGNKFERKEAALKGGNIAAMSGALVVGALLTPINVPIKFIENFGKALLPKGSNPPEVYKKFDDSYKTNVLPFCMTIGKKAVAEQRKSFDLDKTAIFKAHDKMAAMEKEAKKAKMFEVASKQEGGVSGMSVFTQVSLGKTNIDSKSSSKGPSNEFLIHQQEGPVAFQKEPEVVTTGKMSSQPRPKPRLVIKKKEEATSTTKPQSTKGDSPIVKELDLSLVEKFLWGSISDSNPKIEKIFIEHNNLKEFKFLSLAAQHNKTEPTTPKEIKMQNKLLKKIEGKNALNINDEKLLEELKKAKTSLAKITLVKDYLIKRNAKGYSEEINKIFKIKSG
jgi:hypothetical protein